MKIDIGKDAVNYVRKKGGIVNIDLYTSKSCCAEVTEPVINFGLPKALTEFNEYSTDDIKIYVSRFIHLKGEVLTIKLKSVLGIKGLTLSGIKML